MQKKIFIGLALTLIIVIFIPVYWAMEPTRQEAALNRQQAEALERVGEPYASSCAICHGVNRKGVPGLGTALTPDSLATLSDTETRDVILNGQPGTEMAAYKEILSPEEIDALLQLIKHTSP